MKISKEEWMRKLALCIWALGLTAAPAALAASGPGAGEPADARKVATPAATQPGEPAKPAAAATNAELASEVSELRALLRTQSEQLEEQRHELEALKTRFAAAGPAGAAPASASAATAGEPGYTAAISNDPAEPDKKDEGPKSWRFKGITIAPGGFIAAETVVRQRTTSGDINTPFTGTPYPGNSLSKVTEFNASGRQSRMTLLAEAKLASAKLSAYYEADFLGSGTTSNNRQSNSYVFRQRQLWAMTSFESGWRFSAGQMWTLAEENKKSIENRQEWFPMQIDAQYIVGFTWERTWATRVVKSWNDKFTLGFSMEGPQTTAGGRGFSTYTPLTGNASQNSFFNAPGAGGGLFNATDTTGYTVNQTPDFLFKAAFDPGFGHYEIFGILSTFRARVYPCAVVGVPTILGVPNPAQPTLSCAQNPSATTPTVDGAFNDTRQGGGFGASGRISIFNNKLGLGVKGVYGTGIGRFGSAQLADVTIRPNGTLSPIHGGHGLGSIEWHVTPKLDVYGYAGAEYAARAKYSGYQSVKVTSTTISQAVGTPVTTLTTIATSNTVNGGYGNALFNNSGCNTETTPLNQNTPGGGGTCAGDIRVIIEGTAGFWYKFYQGDKGRLQWGLQYAYLVKNAWSGTTATPGATQFNPTGTNNMVFTSFRYYIP
jgi:hypothetical protein